MSRPVVTERRFFDVAWTMFRAAMKGIFVVASVIYLFAVCVMALCTGDLFRMAPQEVVTTLAATLLMGLFVVSYISLFLAVPLSAVCALLALVMTLFGRLTATVPDGCASGPPWAGYPSPPPPDPRIEILEARIDSEAAICPVCAAAIVGESVACKWCEALHHRECWEYAGSCATFGCGGSIAVPADGRSIPGGAGRGHGSPSRPPGEID